MTESERKLIESVVHWYKQGYQLPVPVIEAVKEYLKSVGRNPDPGMD